MARGTSRTERRWLPVGMGGWGGWAQEPTGRAFGRCTVVGIGAFVASFPVFAEGTSVAAAFFVGAVRAVGTAAGTSTVAGTGQAVVEAVGTAAGTSTASGNPGSVLIFTYSPEDPETEIAEFSMTVATGGGVDINWGDGGSLETASVGNAVYNHEYAAAGTYEVRLEGRTDRVTLLEPGPASGWGDEDVGGSVEDAAGCQNVVYWRCNDTAMYGDISAFGGRAGMIHVCCNNCTGVVGDVDQLLDGYGTAFIHLDLGDTSCEGSIAKLVNCPYMYTLIISNEWGTGDITGSLEVLSANSAMQYLQCSGNPGLTGDLGTICTSFDSSLQQIQLNGTAVDGDLGDLPAGLTGLQGVDLGYLSGLTGLISDLAALSAMNFLQINDTGVTGDVGDLISNTNLWMLRCWNTAVAGDVGDLAAHPTLAVIAADNTDITYPDTATWSTNFGYLTFNDCGWVSADVDRMIIDVEAAGTSSGTLRLAGTNQPRTSASTTAYNALIARSWSIQVNGP